MYKKRIRAQICIRIRSTSVKQKQRRRNARGGKKMAPLALKLVKKMNPSVHRRKRVYAERDPGQLFEEKTGAGRAVDMLVNKLNGREYVTEYPMPSFDRVEPGPAIKNMAFARIALVTSGGIVPKGNPDHIESSSASSMAVIISKT